MKHISKKVILISILSSIASRQAMAQSSRNPIRAGFSFGAIRTGGTAISFDTGPVLNGNITAGSEFFNLSLVALRTLMWEQPGNMAGFNGGPKLYLGFASKFALEPGAEIGWLYRMKNRIDVGAGIDLVFANAIGGSIKIGAGILF